MWDFFETNMYVYEELLDFTEDPVDMRNWQNKLNAPEFGALKTGYQSNKTAYLKKGFGIFKYHKKTLDHYSVEASFSIF